MHRQIIVSGLPGDPDRPLTWGYQDHGPSKPTRLHTDGARIVTARDPVPTGDFDNVHLQATV